jgi:PAS domain S-box-containing protein
MQESRSTLDGSITVQNEELAQLRLMQSTVEHARDFVLIVEWRSTEPTWLIQYVNQAFLDTFGYERGELIGELPTILCGPESDLELLFQNLGEVLAGRSVLFELLHYRKDGSSVVLELSIFPLHVANGVLTHSVAFGRDISERKAAEGALIRAKVAEESNAALRNEIAERLRAEAQLAHAAFQCAGETGKRLRSASLL